MKEVEQVLTTNEIANVLGVNRHKASDLMASGKIRAFKIGNRWRATKSALESYMRGQEPQETELRELDSKLTEPCPFCGCNIETVRCEGTDRFGNPMRFARYYLRDSTPDSSDNLL